MKKPNEEKVLSDLFGSEAGEQLLSEMGILDVPREEQVRILTALGKNIINRILFETMKALPESDLPEFERLFDLKDIVAMQEFLRPRVPDFDQFIQQEARREFEATKTRLHEIEQGVDV